MPYTVTLVNLENVSAAQREAMEQTFRATLEKLFGGPEGVVAAWQACLAERILVPPGTVFGTGGRFRNCLRIGVGGDAVAVAPAWPVAFSHDAAFGHGLAKCASARAGQYLCGNRRSINGVP